MTAKFTFNTLTQSSTRYRAPSGNEYVFYKGQPTIVTDSEDIRYFDDNKRFTREKRNAKTTPQPGADEQLLSELKKIKGVGPTTATKIVDQFTTKEELASHLDAGNSLEGVSAEVQLSIHKKIADREVDE